MSPVNSVSSTSSFIESMNAQTSTLKQTELSDQFMQLLIIELKNQNPLEPMKSDEMVAQMTQLNSLKELQSISTALKEMDRSNQFLTASYLIGKKITYKDSTEQTHEGVVDSIKQEGATVSLMVGGLPVLLDNVTVVKAG